MSDLMSRPYKPGAKCCERCVFGRGEHAEWCWPCPNPFCNGRLELSQQFEQPYSSAYCGKCGTRTDTTRLSIKCKVETCSRRALGPGTNLCVEHLTEVIRELGAPLCVHCRYQETCDHAEACRAEQGTRDAA